MLYERRGFLYSGMLVGVLKGYQKFYINHASILPHLK